MPTPISSLHQERCASQSPRVADQSRGHFQREALPPVTMRFASPVVREVLRRMRLSSAEQQLLTMLNAASPAPVGDTALLAALGETWHAERLHSRMKHLREKLWPHGLMLLRALNYGYALIEIEMP
jgi:hypothetical protein